MCILFRPLCSPFLLNNPEIMWPAGKLKVFLRNTIDPVKVLPVFIADHFTEMPVAVTLCSMAETAVKVHL